MENDQLLSREEIDGISKAAAKYLFDQHGISTMVTMTDGDGVTNHFAGKFTVLELLTIAYSCISKTLSKDTSWEDAIKTLNQLKDAIDDGGNVDEY